MSTPSSTHEYTPFSKFQSTGPWDVIVIGSGMGGMACAAALAKYGRKVLVLEQHYVPGGFTHTFTRKGYTWDVGVHCVGEMGEKDIPGKLLNWLSEGGVTWQNMGDVYEKFFYPEGFQIDFPGSRDGFRRALYEKFPEARDRESIDRYFETVRAVVRDSKPFFALRTAPKWVDGMGTKLLFRKKRDWWSLTTAEVLEEFVPNPKLRAVLTSQWGYYGSTPKNSSFAIHALTVRHFWGGGFYPQGGAATIAESLGRVVRAAGGEFVTRAEVDEILIRNGKACGVRMKDGRELLAPRVVSAAGAKNTVERLLPTVNRGDAWARELSSLKQSPPYICYYIGLEGDVQAAGATVANQWFFETWDMEHAEWDLRDPNAVAPCLYVSFPSLKDPKHDPGPTNRHTMEVVTFVPWDVFEPWKETRRGFRTPEYAAFKKGIEDRLVAQLNRHIPKLMKLVKHAELSTPLSTQHFTRAPQGAIYGLAPTPTRFRSPSLRTRTPVKNLYLAGGDVATLGVTGALVGGILAASTLEPRVFSKLM